MEDWHLGYLAAMIDAESHVGIQRLIGKKRRNPSYVVRFELAMTDLKPVAFVNSLLPHAKVLHQAAIGRRLPYYRLRLTQQEALSFLRLVYPYVQGKKRQIELCFEIDALRRRFSPSRRHFGMARFQPLPPDFAEQADVLFQEFRSLQMNKKPKE